MPCALTGFSCDWLHHSASVPFVEKGQRFVAFTTMVLNGPVEFDENGFAVAVTSKQRPHASPAPEPGGAPKVSWLIPAVKPVAFWPHAARVTVSTVISVCARLWSAQLALLTGSAAARVLREGRSALGDLQVAARGCELGHTTAHGSGEKRYRYEDGSRFHGSTVIG